MIMECPEGRLSGNAEVIRRTRLAAADLIIPLTRRHIIPLTRRHK